MSRNFEKESLLGGELIRNDVYLSNFSNESPRQLKDLPNNLLHVHLF